MGTRVQKILKSSYSYMYIVFFVVIIASYAMLSESTSGDSKKGWAKIFVENYKKEYGKIRDPYHPYFDPDEFQFEDYSATHCMMYEVMAKLFPKGVPKEFVDRILVDSGGAIVKPSVREKNKYNYLYELKTGPLIAHSGEWNIAIQFDDHDSVLDVQIGGVRVYNFLSECRWFVDYGKNWSGVNE